MKIQVFWDVTLFCWVSGSGCFEGLHFLHLQDPAVHELLDPDDEDKVIFQSNENYLPKKTVPYSRESESLNVT